MLDRLLGRAALKERIEELEEEVHHLERERDAEKQRRADAVSDRQDAEERVNRLEDRIAELEGEIDRLEGGADADLDFRGRETLRGERLAAVLDRLDSFETGPESALTAYVDNDDLPDPVVDAFGDRAQLVARAAPCLAVADDAGLVSATLSVPAPPARLAGWDDEFGVERSWFEPTGEFALALVRSDLFAMGEYDGRERTGFYGFEGDLKSKHSKGGFSQARFERLRDEQIETHVDRCLEALDETDAETLYVVGERTVLGEFSGVADVTATVDATGDPEDALEAAFRQFWTVRLATI